MSDPNLPTWPDENPFGDMVDEPIPGPHPGEEWDLEPYAADYPHGPDVDEPYPLEA